MLKRFVAALAVFFAAVGYALGASSTLSNLSAGTAITDGDLFYDVQSVGSGGVKVTASQLATYLSSKFGLVNKTTVTLTSSQILNAATTPITVVPAVANSIVSVLQSFYIYDYNTTTYTGPSAGEAGLFYQISGFPSFSVPADSGGDGGIPLNGVSYSNQSLNGQALAATASIADIPVVYGNTGTNYSGGNGTMKIIVYWTTVPSQ